MHLPERDMTGPRRMRLAMPALLLAPVLCWSPARAAASGSALYAQQCAACHQADAAGSAGDYPPLKNRVDKIAATPEGQHYLADVLTHGMSGTIQAGGDSYNGYMPSFAALKDDEIAAILTYVSSLGDSKPDPAIDVADVAAARARTLSAADVVKERATLDAQHKLP